MNQSLERILINLAGNNDLQQVSLGELEKITDEHPYFSISHILLANKLQFKGDERSQKQAQLAALYSHNPWWLHYQLTDEMEQLVSKKSVLLHEPGVASENKTEVSKIEDDKGSKAPETTHSVVPLQDRDRVLLTDGDDNVGPEALLTQTTTLPVLQEDEVERVTTLHIQEEDWDEDPRFEKEEIAETNDDEVLHANVEEDDEVIVNETQKPDDGTENISHAPEVLTPSEEVGPETALVPITTEFTHEELEVAGKLAHETLAVVNIESDSNSLFVLPGKEAPEIEVPITTEFTQQELDEASKLAHAALATTGAEPTGEPLFVLPVATEDVLIEEEQEREIEQELHNKETNKLKAEEVKTEIEEQPKELSPIEAIQTTGLPFSENQLKAWKENATEEETEFELPEASPEAYSNDQMLQNIKSILDTPLTTDKAAAQSLIPIDPYYTVDYFASQGIKLVLESEPTDQLGKKLKKFTHWLRHMKKLGPEDALALDEEDDSEATVIRIADFSNTQREIITEAMAAVLEKQGKKEKAIQIYIKLSFLYPDKSAYFADKIKILKGIK